MARELTPQQKWNRANKEKLRVATAKWRSQNRERARESCRAWKKANPEKHAELQMRRKARIKGQTPSDADFDRIRGFYTEARRLSVETGIDHQVDHILAIANGGLHHQDNLQILTAEENRLKGST